MSASGLPTERNVHAVAQSLEPGRPCVYVADDPVALNHARALLATNERTGVVEGDILHPDELVDPPCSGGSSTSTGPWPY